MRFQLEILLLGLLAILASACSSPLASAAGEALEPVSREVSPLAESRFTCPVTRSPDPAFVPPTPWPALPPNAGSYWLGDPGLWTALPQDGSWRQLALGEKFWWWSEEFDVREDTTPDLRITARRLDREATAFETSEATNGFHESFQWAMLAGVQLPSAGCWEFMGEYKGHELSFVLWVPE